MSGRLRYLFGEYIGKNEGNGLELSGIRPRSPSQILHVRRMQKFDLLTERMFYRAFCLVKPRSSFWPAPLKRFRAMNERSVAAIASRISAFSRSAS
jgi:hypothetical protein